MHPSLEAEFILPPMLEPKRNMGRNEPCWCGSKKKWKVCHRDRHLQKEVHIGELSNQMHIEQGKGICLHPDASPATCSSKIIKAHTVQKSGGLIAIAENGHVISSKKGFENISKNNGKIIPESLGIGKASTFMGFCGIHDNKLFESIEHKSSTLNKEAAFLLSFRAISYEYFQKQCALETIELQRAIDKGKDFETQKYIQNHLHITKEGMLRGMKNLILWKKDYDKSFIENDFFSLPYYAIEFDGILPFVCCGGFHPEIDFSGNQLQIITRGDAEMEHVCINISVFQKKTFVAFGWHGNESGPSQEFVKSFASIPNTEKANTLLHLAVEQVENIYFKPSWWNNIGSSKQAILIKRMRSGIGENAIRSKDTYTSLSLILDSVPVSNELGSILEAF